MTPEEARLVSLARALALAHGLDPSLVCAVIEQESSWNPWAMRYEPAFFAKYVASLYTNNKVSASEAYARGFSWGLMQVMGQVAREHGFGERFLSGLCDPSIGIEFGCRVLRKKIDLREPTTIAEATANIGRISTLVAQRKLGVDEGNDLTAILGKWIEAKVSAELEERIIMIEVALAKANINLGIAVGGGLPDLPLGPDDGKLIMPAKLLPLSPQPSELPSDKPPLDASPTDEPSP